MRDAITVETDQFEHREVKPHFINPCCFGEDFAAWLLTELAPLEANDFDFSKPIQEDYGWGIEASRESESLWIALSFMGDGPQNEPAQWSVSVEHQSGANVLNRLFHRPDTQVFERVRDRIWQALAANPSFTTIE